MAGPADRVAWRCAPGPAAGRLEARIPQKRQEPDSAFKGTENLITQGIASHEPRGIGEICDPSNFSEVMEVPATLLSPNSKEYQPYLAVDLTGPDGQRTPGGPILAQHTFADLVPW